MLKIVDESSIGKSAKQRLASHARCRARRATMAHLPMGRLLGSSILRAALSFTTTPHRLQQGRTRSASAASSGLACWHAAVNQVPARRVLPMGFGGEAESGTSAWYGDKVLGAAVAAELEARRVTGKQRLSEVYSAAVSNRNMAASLNELLPKSLVELIPQEQLTIQEHDCGTLLEACVHEVHSSSGGRDAIAELARFLLDRASEAPVNDEAALLRAEHISNPKGKLLDLGGTLESEWVSGPPNLPVFRARADYRGFTEEGVAGSKKGAEQEAAAKVLRAACVPVTSQPKQRMRLDAMVMKAEREAAALEDSITRAGDASLHWEPVGEEYELTANLKNGEDQNEWFRRKSNLHRCLCAPLIFQEVQSVQAWKCAFEGGNACLVLVTGSEDGSTKLFSSPRLAPSNTEAQRLPSALAHAHILELIQT